MAKGYLNGVDVSSNQPERILTKIDYDFVVVKVGGNPRQGDLKWNYINPYLRSQADDAYIKTHCLGLYWFCYGLDDYKKEADLFVQTVKSLGYLNKAILIVDYEAYAVKKGRDWLRNFARRIREKAGYDPMIYASGGIIKEQKLSSLGYQIWCANYYLGDKKIHGYSTKGMKLYCPEAKMWQYTEYGYLDGYNSRLDLNRFFGSKEEWAILAGGKAKTIDDGVKVEIKAERYKIIADSLNIRDKRSTLSGRILGQLKKGSKIYLKNVRANTAGNVWGEIATGTFKGRYICLQFKGKVYAKKG